MSTTAIGLKELKMGPVAGDGGMGTVLEVLSATVVDTAVLTNEAPTTTDFPIEEQDDPIYSTSVAGKRTIAWSTYNVTPDALVRVLGGSVVQDASGNDVWEAPLNTPQIYQSVQLTTLDGDIVKLVRVKIDAIIEWNFQKSKLAQVNITGTILKPEKDNTPPLTITKLAS